VAKQTRILTEVGCNVVLFAAKPRPVMQTAVNTTWHIRLITTVKPQVYMRIKQHKHDRHRQPNHTKPHTHTHTHAHTFSTAHYRHCLHSKRVNVTVGRPSVRLSVCLSHHLPAALGCCGFAAVQCRTPRPQHRVSKIT